MCSQACVQELVGLDDYRDGDDELTPEPSDKLGGDSVRLIAPVRGREQWAGVGDDLQLAGTISAR